VCVDKLETFMRHLVCRYCLNVGAFYVTQAIWGSRRFIVFRKPDAVTSLREIRSLKNENV
jgi:hypothetical protein